MNDFSPRILVAGASGYFGSLLIRDLLQFTEARVVAAGRDEAKWEQAKRNIGAANRDRIEFRRIDLNDKADIARVIEGVDLVICAAGPFQKLPTHLLELCIEQGIDYIDIADAPEFVRRAHRLVESRDGNEIRSAVCTGWSTVSALSGALAKIACEELESVDRIDIHMAPGNRAPRAAGTVTSLLSGVGKSFTVTRNGALREVVGGTEPRSFNFPDPIEARKGFLVDVFDHESLPRELNAKTVEFRVSAEFAVFNWGVGMLASASRRKIVSDWAAWTGFFKRAMAATGFLGTERGAVGVEATGWREGKKMGRRVMVIAERGAPRIAVMPASIMAAMLIPTPRAIRGIPPYTNWISQEVLELESKRREIQLVVEDFAVEN